MSDFLSLKFKKCVAFILIFAIVIGSSLFVVFPTPVKSSQKRITITYFVSLDSKTALHYTSYDSLPVYQIMEKKFNVDFKFIHPPSSAFNDQLNLMIASQKLTDVIEMNWTNNYNGGPMKAIADKVIIPLNNYVDKYCPNLKKLLKEHPDWQKQMLTDDGKIYCFPDIIEKQFSTRGPAIRKDWLEKYHLQPPQTVDEWYKVLSIIRKNEPTKPWGYTMVGQYARNAFNFPFLIGAYGILQGFFTDNGKVKFGALEPAFKQFISEAQKWYSAGLFHPNFVQNTNTNQIEPDILNDKVIAWNSAVSSLQTYPMSYQGKQKFSILVCENPVLKKGQILKFWNRPSEFSGSGAAITTACKNIQKVCQVLDWAYSKEGHMYFNFGILGKSYTLDKNGQPVFTDAVLKDSKFSPTNALAKFARSPYHGPFVQDFRAVKGTIFLLPEQLETLNKWSGFDKVPNYKADPPVTFTTEESREYANIMQNVNTFYDEMFVKLIIGKEKNVDVLVKTLKRMGIERAIKLYQQAYDRARKRQLIYK